MSTGEIQEEDQQAKDAGEDKVSTSTAGNKFHRSRTIELVDEMLTGRGTEKSKVIKLIGQPEDEQGCNVISVWGMGGLGKTTLVRSVYRSQQLGGWKRAWATALRPFNREVLLRHLALQLQNDIPTDPIGADWRKQKTKTIADMELQELEDEFTRLLKQKCLIVLDDISSTVEWDLVKKCLKNARRIIVTTREKNIAKHCSREDKYMYNLSGLNDDTALDLFRKKVFKGNTETNDLGPDMMEQARLILKKCDGLPLAITTIGGFLATKPKTAIEWRKMNEHISAELETNPELRTISTILMRSYDGLPFHLKSSFLYLSIFPEDSRIGRKRVVMRWIAEGYSREMHGMVAEEVGNKHFDELFDRSMILLGEGVNHYYGKIGSCQLHDIIREICISKAREENLVFALEEGCCVNSTQGVIRHLVINSNWKRDKDVLESMFDLSRVRSLSVFGTWKSFFISDKMRFLRVLDLEDTVGIKDRHLHQIGKLCHLKYLSLRGCKSIFHLPNSFGNLRHLQTLDVRGTHISELPTTITKLQKLQHLRTTDLMGRQKQGITGVQAPRGIGKLKALHTLGVVTVARGNGKATLKGLKELTHLHKLGVAGVNGRNSHEFWSSIAGHSQLQSLSVCMYNTGDELDGCLSGFDWDLLPPKCLESLKVYGKLVRATEWIHQLEYLSKLLVENTYLGRDAIRAFGKLRNLAVLRLRAGSILGPQLHFQGSSFQSLMVMELSGFYFPISVEFEEHAMPKLELLQFDECWWVKISGLAFLTSLKEIRLGGWISDEFKKKVTSQVAEHPKHVSLKFM